jgi:hypothetical protein
LAGIPDTDDIIDVYPATALQAALIVQNDMDKSSYINQMVGLLKQPLDKDRFASGLTNVAKKHDILRTRFVRSAMGVYLALQSHADIEVTEHDNLAYYCENDIQRGFSINDKSWLRACLVTEAKGMYLVLTIHHVLYDGWCLDMLLRDIWLSYEGTMTEYAIPFKSVIEYFEYQDSSVSLEYWTEHLKGCEFGDRFRHLKPSANGAKDESPVSRSIALDTQQIKGMGLTLATICKSAWALTLRAFTRSDDVVFGSVVSGRDIGVLGVERYFCINTVWWAC